jgi:hypothetical protein
MSMQKACQMPGASGANATVSRVADLFADQDRTDRLHHPSMQVSRRVPHLDWPDDLFDELADA